MNSFMSPDVNQNPCGLLKAQNESKVATGQAYNPILERKPLQRSDASSDTSPTRACYSLPYHPLEIPEYTLSGKVKPTTSLEVLN